MGLFTLVSSDDQPLQHTSSSSCIVGMCLCMDLLSYAEVLSGRILHCMLISDVFHVYFLLGYYFR